MQPACRTRRHSGSARAGCFGLELFFQARQFAFDRAAQGHLRFRRRELFFALALDDDRSRELESLAEREGVAQRLIEIGLAEIGPIRFVAAAEGVPVCGRSGDYESVLVLYRIDKTAGIARRY